MNMPRSLAWTLWQPDRYHCDFFKTNQSDAFMWTILVTSMVISLLFHQCINQTNNYLFYQLLKRTKGAVMNHLVTTIISYSNETCLQSRMFNAQVDLVGGVMEASFRKQLANLNYLSVSLDMLQSKFMQQQQVGSSIRAYQAIGRGNNSKLELLFMLLIAAYRKE